MPDSHSVPDSVTQGASQTVTLTGRTVIFVVMGRSHHASYPVAAYYDRLRALDRAFMEDASDKWQLPTQIAECYLDG
jgi:hypothetical protein